MGVSVRWFCEGWYLFVRHRGQRAAKKFNKQEQAEQVAAAVRHAITLGQFDIAAMKQSRQDPGKTTLRSFYEETVLPLWDGSVARATYKSYEGSFRVHVLPALGDCPLKDLTRNRVKAFVATLRKKTAAKRDPKEKARSLSRETIRNVLAALRSALSEAAEANLIAGNPAVKLGKFYKEAKDFHEEIDPFSAEEVSLLLQTARQHFGFENYVMMLTLFHCGLRAGELAGLQWSDLDVRNKTVLVRRQFSRGQVSKTKTRKKRPVDVSSALMIELQALRKQRQADYLQRGKNEIPEWIFLGPGQIIWEEGKPVGRKEGHPVDMANWRNRVYWKTCDKAGIRRRRVHDTRHTFASLLLSNGEPLKYVSAQMGHASIRITADVYGHLEVGANRAAMDRLPVAAVASNGK